MCSPGPSPCGCSVDISDLVCYTTKQLTNVLLVVCWLSCQWSLCCLGLKCFGQQPQTVILTDTSQCQRQVALLKDGAQAFQQECSSTGVVLNRSAPEQECSSKGVLTTSDYLQRRTEASPADACVRVVLREGESLAKKLPVPPDLHQTTLHAQGTSFARSLAVAFLPRSAVVATTGPITISAALQAPRNDLHQVMPSMSADLFATHACDWQPKAMIFASQTRQVQGNDFDRLGAIPIAGDAIPP